MDIVADLHTHTVASGHAYCTIQELAAAAKEKGIEILAMTDHGPAMPGGPHPYHFGNLKVLPEKISGVEILKGIEANIIDSRGTLDLPINELAKLDLVLAGFHNYTGYSPGTKKENTETLLKAIRNPLVDIIVHPGNPEYEIQIEPVVEAARENDTLLEINNSSYHSRPGSRSNCLKIAAQLQEADVPIVMGTDTHYADQIGEFTEALRILDEAGVRKTNILNASREKLEQFINKKQQIKQKYK